MFEKLINIYIKRREVLNYLVFGVLTTVVNWIVFQIFNAGLSVHWSIANVIAWICSVLFAYVTNRRFVFKSASRNIIREIALFVQFRLISLLLEMLILFVLIERLSAAPFTSKVIAAVVVVAANYFFSKLIIFKERRSGNGSH
jgi:putative flippase GtrA